jgi:para-nitrobenzyl esterase
MVGYWTEFVKTGEPDCPPLGASAANGPRMSLQSDGPHTFTNFDDEHQCAFWSTVKGR